ncbi:ras guanine-nucleotide exchange protein [Lichtheimia corymbifera JMRC:FSU:9682]|uniref:Ras guanine-nucleotide exchange protein n=1 Tax=Lichtheimia corymbifera JMRC:FSU:9682 TaxID=1263082 RepID=A0A068S9T6_9FUNG|nr:ras guanine-nucleotide exchange protein [Lichtheimia corymbifera JMRC:FSU:9682]
MTISTLFTQSSPKSQAVAASSVSLSPPASLPSSPRNTTTPPEPSTLTSHFVQALHDYLPTNAPADEAVSCLFFRKGAIIEVFNRDPSGWWDGVSNGVRGWFPSNYIGRIGEATRDSADFDDEESQQQWESWRKAIQEADAYHHQHDEHHQSRVELARALLDEDRSRIRDGNNDDTAAAAYEEYNNDNKWEMLMDDVSRRMSELVNAATTTTLSSSSGIPSSGDDIQAHVFQVVSSIRAVLTAANAVSNDSPVLKTHPDLARQRKIILSTLSKLVLKGKEWQQQQQQPSIASADISGLVNQLLAELEIFEDHLKNVPEFFIEYYGTSLGSVSPRSSLISADSSHSFRHMQASLVDPNQRRLSSASFIARVVPLSDPRHILQTLLEHQATISELMSSLWITIEQFLAQRQRASEMLETTRKAVEAIRTFLAVVEHVCSHVGDMDYKHCSVIPEDPHLVALVLAKESVYSSITNLVTSVRTLAGPRSSNNNGRHHQHNQQQQQQPSKADIEQLRDSCENVVRTTHESAACVQICLQSSGDTAADISSELRERFEQSIDTRRNQTLSILGCKATSLNVLQQQCDDNDVESLAITRQSTNTVSTRTNSTSTWQQQRHSGESTATLLTTPEVMSPVNEQQHHPLATFNGPLPPPPPPPAPSTNHPIKPPELKLSTSKSTPTSDHHHHQKKRSLHLLSKHHNHHHDTMTSTNTDSRPQMRRTSSWLSVNGTERNSPSKNEHEPWFLRQRVFSEDEMMLNNDGQVTGATVEALVEKLTQHEKSPELLFLRAFFYNFRLFTTPTIFLELLIKRFDIQPPTPSLSQDEWKLWTNHVLIPVRLRVYNVIKTWLETFFSYDTDACIEQPLIEFVTGSLMQVMAAPGKRMMELVRKCFTSKGQMGTTRKLSYTSDSIRPPLHKQPSGSHLSLASGTSLFSTLTLFEDHHSVDSSSSSVAPTPNIARSLRNTLRKAMNQGMLSSVHVSEFEPIELARQLTLMESSLFCQIQPNEMIGQEFKKKVGNSTAVHVKAMIHRSTQITKWVSDTILNETDAKKRAHMIKFWIKVGDQCLQLRNYNTLMAIRSALDSTSIGRLKRTWECVSAKCKAMYEPIYRATDSQRNFAEYRRRLRDAVAPCLPFLGVYLTDMTFIDDGNANHRMSPNGHQLINFDKYIKTTRILNEIDQFQIPYKLAEVEEIQRYLLHCLETVEKNDQVFYTRSLQLEPREEDFDIKSFISNLA